MLKVVLPALLFAFAVVASAHAETKDRLTVERMRRLLGPAQALVSANRIGDARAAFSRVRALARRSPIADHDLVTAFGVQLCMARDSPDAAFPYLREAIVLSKRAFGPGHPETALAYTSLADCMRRAPATEHSHQREWAYRRALKIRTTRLGPGDTETAGSQRDIAAFTAGLDLRTLRQARIDEAVDLYGRAAATFARLGPAAAIELARTLGARGKLFARIGRLDDAIADYRALTASDTDPFMAQRTDLCQAIAEVYRGRGDVRRLGDWSARCGITGTAGPDKQDHDAPSSRNPRRHSIAARADAPRSNATP